MTTKHKRPYGAVKKKIRIDFFELIKRLRKSGLNWTDISKYLSRYHAFKVRPKQLKTCFENIQREQN